MADADTGWYTLARLLRPQGRRGEVLAELFTDFPEQLATSPGLVLSTPAGERQPATVEAHWRPTGRNAGRVVLKLAGTDSISDAEKLAGGALEIPVADRAPLDAETFYVSDLVGCLLSDGPAVLGTVIDVQFPVDPNGRRLDDSPALFVVGRAGGDDVLVPFVNAFVDSIDVEEKRITMSLPTGLLDVNS